MSRLMVPPYALLRGAQGAALAGAPVPFDASDPFAKYAAPGVWVKDFDYGRAADSGLSRLYTTGAGQIAIVGTTETIGMVLDDSQGAAVGASIFADAFGYADTTALLAAGWEGWHSAGQDNTILSLSSGKLRVTNGVGQDFSRATKAISGFIVGQWYKMSVAYTVVAPASMVMIMADAQSGGTELARTGTLSTGGTHSIIFRATATALYPRFTVNDTTDARAVEIDDLSIVPISGNHLNQPTNGQRGTSQDVGGVKVWRPDAVDDNLLAAISPAVGTTMFIRVKPTGAARYLAGTLGGSTTRFYMTCNATTGQLGAGVGSVTESTITGGSDIQNIEGVAVLRATGDKVSLWWYPVGGALALLYDGSQTGSPTTTIPFRFGAINNNGTVGSAPMAGDLYKIFVVQAAMSDADVATMAAAMAA